MISRELPGAPHEILLVLDCHNRPECRNAGAKISRKTIRATGIVLTKLDGTSKGGVVVRIAGELELPVRFIGVWRGFGRFAGF